MLSVTSVSPSLNVADFKGIHAGWHFDEGQVKNAQPHAAAIAWLSKAPQMCYQRSVYGLEVARYKG